ncbi:agmatinase [Candidatus Marinamargulisbacteria bacterium SCGC AG-414-C22]|nr:agmatinase [Candidatus Marinamargulisbacteria bacterium SCGC AG-414-C22]
MHNDQNLFGLYPIQAEADIHVIPVPWDVTASFRKGTALAPQHIKAASLQCEIYHPDYQAAFDEGIYMLPEHQRIKDLNKTYSPLASKIMTKSDQHTNLTVTDKKHLNNINIASNEVNQLVYQLAEESIKENKLIGLIGGDHSTPLGFIQALADYIPSFGVLHFDSHMDLRSSYQGFDYSHATIMHHVLGINDITRIVQVGVRDYSEEEVSAMKSSKGKIKTYFNHDLKRDLYQGRTWENCCKKIINNCPDLIYISFDIDCLSPEYCPNTGTPVPGGLDFDQVSFLLAMLVKAKKRIIGFDCVEVAGEANSLDVIVGSRVLSLLAGYTHLSNQE